VIGKNSKGLSGVLTNTARTHSSVGVAPPRTHDRFRFQSLIGAQQAANNPRRGLEIHIYGLITVMRYWRVSVNIVRPTQYERDDIGGL
jgi:hypothetical protein